MLAVSVPARGIAMYYAVYLWSQNQRHVGAVITVPAGFTPAFLPTGIKLVDKAGWNETCNLLTLWWL
jgi:hypothetical protein